MLTLCQSCEKRKPLARTKKNPKYRLIPNHDLCQECERRVWDRLREIQKEKETNDN